MSSNIQDLSGHTVYVRVANSLGAMPKDTAFDSLVGEGKLVSHPNDVVAGEGSKWVHQRATKNTYGVFGRRIRSFKSGRTRNARCILMLPVDWWWECHEVLANMDAAEIGFPIWTEGRIEFVYAGMFMPTKHPQFPAMKNTRSDGTGSLEIDRTTNMHFEFSCIGREVLARRTEE